ncbi:unnamed protein product [Polarella glacialis]|uniref:PIPK domain-containing protein n=1 Tax=Polarella glacialis TaxID=89957 RepID=A0A813DTP0_POLGL|nr:unnamed protein product [Polarella glacialis]
MWANAAKKVHTYKSASDAFHDASDEAVASANKPGKKLDLASSSDAARAARAMQEAISGEPLTDGSSVVSHEEEVFARVRLHFGRSKDQYRYSLSEGTFRFLGEEEAAGKSSAFFVFTEDGRYCVKSVDPSEAQMLARVIVDYEQYVLKHKDTLLPKFYGLYEVRLSHRRKPLWMMVQGNVLGGRTGVIQRFDLKGSTHGRKASAKEWAKGRSSVLKDLDFVLSSCALLGATPAAKQQWEQWVQRMGTDSAWLASQGLIDYSLLLGFSSCKPELLKKPLSHVNRLEVQSASLGDLSSSIPAEEALVVYVGIIDCLMPYNWFKRCENVVCGAFFSADISCQPPVAYATRFINFVRKLVSPPGELQEFTTKRQMSSQRLLGYIVGEFGRKDAQHVVKYLTLLVITGGLGRLAVFLSSQRKLK